MMVKKPFESKNPDVLTRTYVHAIALIIVHFSPGLGKTFTVAVPKLYGMVTD